MSNRLLNERELADRLGLTTKCLQTWRQSGKGPAYLKLSRAVRYSEAAVDEWLTKQTHGNEAAR